MRTSRTARVTCSDCGKPSDRAIHRSPRIRSAAIGGAQRELTRDRRLVRRQPARGRYDRASIDAVLDAGLVAHVAFVDAGQPYCIPMMYARVDDSVCIHGSTASRTVKMLATGTPACLTVTVVDGLVLARSAFEHSANYEAAMVFGSFTRVADADEKLAALE